MSKLLSPERLIELREWFLQHKRANPLAQELLAHIAALAEQLSQMREDLNDARRGWEDATEEVRNLEEQVSKLTAENFYLQRKLALAPRLQSEAEKERDRLAERVTRLKEVLKTIRPDIQHVH